MPTWVWILACSAVEPTAPTCATGDCRPDIARIAIGDEFGCALRVSGRLDCWGRNQDGQLGTGAFAEIDGSSTVLDDALSVSAGARHACAIRIGGAVSCWGANDREQVSREAGDWAAPRQVAVPVPAVEVAAGWTTSCARAVDGAVWCWGDDVPSPRRIPGVVAVSLANGKVPCALEADGDVACWQGVVPTKYEVGASLLAVDREIAAVAEGRILVWTPGGEAREVGRVANATSISVVRGGVYASSRNGELWGFSSGEGPVPLPVGRGLAISGRGHSACALADGVVSCWGPDAAGLVPRGILRPRRLDATGTVYAGGAGTCIVGEEILCYAENGRRKVPLGPVAALALGERGQWLVRPDGSVERWDRDGTGGPIALPPEQLGAGDRLACSREPGGTVWCADLDEPPIARPMGARAVAVGGRFACAVSGAGEVSCWEGASGQAQTVAGLPPVTRVAVGSNLACASGDGTWCWNHWRTGLVAATAPVGVGVAGAEDLAVGLAHGCALAEGAVWCWGANERGQLGDGTTRGRTAAAKVALPEASRRIDLGHSHSCAEGIDGSVWCWGHPGGLGERVSENAPDNAVRAPL